MRAISEFDLQVAARTIFGEARGEAEEGQRAVAWVIVNRARVGIRGESLAEVCLSPHQFSCWDQDDLNRPKMSALPSDDAALLKYIGMIKAALAAIEPDPTGGATHFYSVKLQTPPAWTKQAIMTKQIGMHRFYKNVV